jgi:hypothetical protein
MRKAERECEEAKRKMEEAKRKCDDSGKSFNKWTYVSG